MTSETGLRRASAGAGPGGRLGPPTQPQRLRLPGLPPPSGGMVRRIEFPREPITVELPLERHGVAGGDQVARTRCNLCPGSRKASGVFLRRRWRKFSSPRSRLSSADQRVGEAGSLFGLASTRRIDSNRSSDDPIRFGGCVYLCWNQRMTPETGTHPALISAAFNLDRVLDQRHL